MSSSRRTGAEMNILAMLDGQTRKPGRFPGLPKAAWYGGGGMLACALVATVAWLVHDQAGSGFEGRVPAGPPVALEIAPETLPNPALHVDPPRMHGAAVVNVDDAGVGAGAPASATPHRQADALTLDDAHQEITALPAVAAAAVSTVVSTAVPAAAAAPLTASGAASATVPGAVLAAPTALLPTAASTNAPAKPSVHASTRMLAKATSSAPRHAAANARRETSAHGRRPTTAPKPKPAPATVDTDVALISAIIQHVNQRGELKDATGCSDKPCPPKMTNRP